MSILLLGIGAIYVLPFCLPSSLGLSVSYRLGYNNHVALIALVLFSFVFALWTKGSNLVLSPPETKSHWAAGSLFYCSLGLSWLACAAIWLESHRVRPFFEAVYFLDRYSMHALGDRLYRDISFDYGPLLFYPPVLLQKILHISIGDSYFLFWSAEWAIGLWLLWFVLGSLSGPSADRRLVYAIFCLEWLPSAIDAGLQYTPFRFIAAAALAVYIKNSAELFPFKAFFLAGVGYAFLIFYSPEQGLAFAIATILYFAVCDRRKLLALPLFMFIAVCVSVFVLAAKAGVLETVVRFNDGDYNFPVLPSAVSFFLLALLIAAGCVVVSAFRNNQERQTELYLIALALIALPAAFGRADNGHIFVNTMPALIVSTLALIKTRTPRYLVLSGWALCLAMALVGQVLPISYMARLSTPRQASLHKRQPGDNPVPLSADLRAPFGYPVTLEGNIDPPVHTGRFVGFGLVNRHLPDEKIQELRERPAALLVVPVNFKNLCDIPSQKDLDEQIRFALRPLYYPQSTPKPMPLPSLCEFVAMHYVKSSFTSPEKGYEVLLPKR